MHTRGISLQRVPTERRVGMKHVSDLWGKSTRKPRQRSLLYLSTAIYSSSLACSAAVAGQGLLLTLNSPGFVPLSLTRQTYLGQEWLGPPAASQCIGWRQNARKAVCYHGCLPACFFQGWHEGGLSLPFQHHGSEETMGAARNPPSYWCADCHLQLWG